MYLTSAGQRLRPLSRGVAILAIVMAARAAHAEKPAGGLLGFVEDAHGAPISGAVISLFGKGIGGTGSRDPVRQRGALRRAVAAARSVHAARSP